MKNKQKLDLELFEVAKINFDISVKGGIGDDETTVSPMPPKPKPLPSPKPKPKPKPNE